MVIFCHAQATAEFRFIFFIDMVTLRIAIIDTIFKGGVIFFVTNIDFRFSAIGFYVNTGFSLFFLNF